MLKISRWLSVAVVALCFSSSHRPVTHSSEQKPDEVTEKRLAQVAASLRIDEPLRYLLESGFRGNGIHEPWMDAMKREGVREVLVEVKGVWYRTIGFRPDKVVRVVYRAEYSRPDSQFIDDVRLEAL